MNISAIGINTNSNFKASKKNDLNVSKESAVDSFDKKDKMSKPAKISLLAGLSAIVLGTMKKSVVTVEKFVQKGGFVENNIVKMKNKKGKIKNFTGKINQIWQDSKDKTIHSFKVKNGKIKKFNFYATEENVGGCFKSGAKIKDTGKNIKVMTSDIGHVFGEKPVKDIKHCTIDKADEMAKKQDEMLEYLIKCIISAEKE